MTINTKTSPLIILGFDIGHASSIGRWAQEGHLPTLASIMERGCWGTISSPQQVAEHGAELSLFSGIPQSEHGYYYFRQLQPNTYDLGLILPHETDIRPFWSYLQDQDLKIAILDTAEVAPIKGMRGIHLANWACNQPAFPHLHPSTEPPELLQEVEDFFGPQIFLSEFEPKSSFKQDMDEYHGFLKRVEKKGALCPLLLSRDKFDVIFVQFSEAHTAAHRYWNYHVGTKRAKDSYAKLNNALRNIYQAIDREMGLLLDDLPSDANIVMLAAFGMESQYPTTGLIESFCRELGYQAASAPVGSSPPSLNSRLNPLALARRLIPESLRVAISHHLPTTVQERLLADQFQTATDWQQTTAFAIPSMYTSFIHVNLKGRQPQGIVESGAEYQEVLDRLEDDLKQLIDPKTGCPAVLEITRTVDAFNTTPPIHLPDLFVEWQPGLHFMSRLAHPKAELTQHKPGYFRDSYHTLDGFFAAAGPSIRGLGQVHDVALLDFAPTFLALLGQPAPDYMKGLPRVELLQDSVVLTPNGFNITNPTLVSHHT